MKIQTAERASSAHNADNPVYQRHLVAYNQAAKMISGKVLEIGCGEGYGIPILAPKCTEYTAIDKFTAGLDSLPDNAKFIQMSVPYLNNFEDNTFDWVVSFQVIEHIQDDKTYLKEINRVLKPEGKLIFTTPNLKMSLTRNPFHIREYTVEKMAALVKNNFSVLDHQGIFGAPKMMDYHNKNAKTVKRITRWDIFNLQYNLPRWMLKIPYDLANRLNRDILNKENAGLVNTITVEDFYIAQATDECLDHFCIATK